MRLNFLSQPEMILDSPYFCYAISGFQNLPSPAATLTHSSEHMSMDQALSPLNHIGHYFISKQMTCGNQPLSEQGQDCYEILEEIAQCLFSDTQLTTTASDEKSLMSRVNSFASSTKNLTTQLKLAC
ncbi:hypothetical protein Dsin_025480 [Dipteronia sinensis]|uniref:Uncharacterized protein n=1 Tax=Dipteronia sinensis TaxID=43782 RepID=A0AAD9ZW74_9ROSI|nr:hypothetical protein Dsin_025480 [Dipteronia sinensis]